jgi:membrane-bound inhibitor of C-type lysozyme
MHRPIALTLIAAALAACAPRSDAAPEPSTAAPAADTAYPYRTAVYRCEGDYGFTALVTLDTADVVPTDADGTRLFLPERAVMLPHVISASGARYSDGSITYWSKGDHALLEVDGVSRSGCTLDPIWEGARDRGVTFRATGDEPGWVLELTPDDSVRFSYDYGEHTVAAPLPELTHNARGFPAYFVKGADFELNFAIDPRPCTGTMADEAFANTVVVTLERGDEYREFHGCGNPVR